MENPRPFQGATPLPIAPPARPSPQRRQRQQRRARAAAPPLALRAGRAGRGGGERGGAAAGAVVRVGQGFFSCGVNPSFVYINEYLHMQQERSTAHSQVLIQ